MSSNYFDPTDIYGIITMSVILIIFVAAFLNTIKWLMEPFNRSFKYYWIKLINAIVTGLWILNYILLLIWKTGLMPAPDAEWYFATFIRPTILATGIDFLCASIVRLKMLDQEKNQCREVAKKVTEILKDLDK